MSTEVNSNPRNASLRRTYADLAWIAEAADGMRDTELVVWEIEEAGKVRLEVRKVDDPPPTPQTPASATKRLEGIRIDSRVQGRAQVTKLTVEIDGVSVQANPPLESCDALFWTESAIEKFLLPYYHTQRLLSSQQWNSLKKCFCDPRVAAIAHTPPSRAVAPFEVGLSALVAAPGQTPSLRPLGDCLSGLADCLDSGR